MPAEWLDGRTLTTESLRVLHVAERGLQSLREIRMAQTWLSVPEAAALSGYDADYIRKLIRGGKIEARKVVTVWTVDRSSLLAFLKQAHQRGGKRGPKKAI